MSTDDYLGVNRANWDERAPAHAASPGYNVADFIADPTYLSEVVRFDRPRLGDITDLRTVHLQCHIGTDTLSLARLGAKVTGLDLSPASLVEARRLAEQTGAAIEYVESELYAAPEALGTERFDLVYTGIGALTWLPSIARWAEVVERLLVPNGRLFIRDGHPVLWSIEDGRDDDLLVVKYPYFERPEPLILDEPGTYVETDVELQCGLTHEWNHGLGEIVSAVLGVGLELTSLEEHDSVPWCALPGLMAKLDEPEGEWRLIHEPWRVPHSFTLQARKP